MPVAIAPSAPAPPKPVILWSHHRSCSTAFVRAFIAHPGTKVAHEPFLRVSALSGVDTIHGDRAFENSDKSPWYNVTRMDIASILSDNALPTFDSDGKLQADAADERTVFVKDMAQSAFRGEALAALRTDTKTFRGPDDAHTYQPPSPIDATPINPTIFPVSVLRKFTHAFLIRDPTRAIPSVVRGLSDVAATRPGARPGFSSEVAAYICYLEQRILYNFLTDPESEFNTAPWDNEGGKEQFIQQPQPVPLIDASDLLEDPHKVLSQFCNAVGIPFNPLMLKWDTDPVEEFDVPWRLMFKKAEGSSGFERDTRTPEEIARSLAEEDALIVKDLIKKYRGDYECVKP
ncbi:hypothetical protein SISSUDRAFT_1033490 [Sistotremastrum suecicum HHB10207 ss-3]|uniref:P-loop containing nucleoside triphosphate hydrolase protein n=1 Tax=Sistotremastrum suecicum HHB10207 ss-3 TaxID=1314776 RepID=A0A166D8Z6_9AGAM|nr:hypothetical protein SISSUDRAFT_1033490 [Sistotremastrum suecicum HHB10207 ss-3]